MKSLYENSNVDCLVYNLICVVNNGKPKLCKYGIEFDYGDIKSDNENQSEWRGKPAHNMVWKASIVKKHKYNDLKQQEDVDWVIRACKDIVNQVRIDKVLYHYDANYTTTSETANLPDEIIKENVDKLINK